MLESGIYVVATPIGNLADISLRALEVLKGVDAIAAEDTRHTRKLLDHYEIDTPMISFHEHNELDKAKVLIERVQNGESFALVSDAGTPLISDPGHTLMKLAHDQRISVFPVPGSSAVIAALSVSGVPCGKFVFEGFLPAKDKAKRAVLENYAEEDKAVVFYESPHRVLSTLEVLVELFGNRELVVARELTKRFETVRRAGADELLEWMRADANQQKGEFVLILSGKKNAGEVSRDEKELRSILARLLQDMPPKKAAAFMVDVYGGQKKEYYNWAIELKGA